MRDKDAASIADELEEDNVQKVQRIMAVAKSFVPDYNAEAIYKKLVE